MRYAEGNATLGLRNIAIEILRGNNLSPGRALAEFLGHVRDRDQGLMSAVFSQQEMEAAALHYLKKIARLLKKTA